MATGRSNNNTERHTLWKRICKTIQRRAQPYWHIHNAVATPEVLIHAAEIIQNIILAEADRVKELASLNGGKIWRNQWTAAARARPNGSQVRS